MTARPGRVPSDPDVSYTDDEAVEAAKQLLRNHSPKTALAALIHATTPRKADR